MIKELKNFWTIPADDALTRLDTGSNGLTSDEAQKRLSENGANTIQTTKKTGAFRLFISQFKSPVIMILIFATALSFYLQDHVNALIILSIVLISGLLGFWQEYSAGTAVSKLLALVQIKAMVMRDSKQFEIGVSGIVPGDIVILNAGDVIPGDCLLMESSSLFVDESALTGETFPVEKTTGTVAEATPLSRRSNCLWMGTHVISGDAKAVVVHTGKDAEFGKISEHLRHRPQETEFERGIKRFGFFLMQITLILVFLIFAFNVILNKPVIDSFLFSLALAVGLTPQLLPAIISINLSRGAKSLANQKVIVKRLESIENFGSMNILCSDKTGTLTDGKVQLQETFGLEGKHSDKGFLYAYLNAAFEAGFNNPIDEAIVNYKTLDLSGYKKLNELPYDFLRKRLSVLVSAPDTGNIIVTKGALKSVLSVCTKAESENGTIVDIITVQNRIDQLYEQYSGNGYRTLGIAYKNVGTDATLTREQETEMTFLGFITLFDPLKQNILQTIQSLKQLGISLKIITGDNKLITTNIVRQLGISESHIMTGSELNQISDTALVQKAGSISVFAEIEPNQKERIIIALRKAGNVVGYMGDGINDVSALHYADVSISVDSAVDVAKEAADIVLLEKDLQVLINGVLAGRKTFANTMKYIFMATSANFGNMFSMAGASLFLPFLPLLPKQVLLTNLMTDLPEMTISTDSVDDEMVSKPRRWDIGFIRKFMIVFGFISSFFDYLTFAVLAFALNATSTQFRTGWFIESVVSAALIVLVIRTRKPFIKSFPGKYLLFATLLVVVFTFALPYTPLAGVLGFEPLPPIILLLLAGIVGIYILTAEVAKKLFYRSIKD